MVDYIEQFLAPYGTSTPSYGEIVDFFLDKAEMIGMLPPKTTISTFVHDGNNVSIVESKWEPEDET